MITNFFWKCCLCFLTIGSLFATDYRGQVKFSGLPVPGVTVTASQGGKQFTAITDQQGFYAMTGLADGLWKVQVEMLCFTTINEETTVAADAPPASWELKLLPLDQMKATAAAPPPPAPVTPTVSESPKRGKNAAPVAQNTAGGFQRADLSAKSAQPTEPPPPSDASVFANQDQNELKEKAADGFLINGTRNNGASYPFRSDPHSAIIAAAHARSITATSASPSITQPSMRAPIRLPARIRKSLRLTISPASSPSVVH